MCTWGVNEKDCIKPEQRKYGKVPNAVFVSWFIPLQSDSQTLTKLDEKTSKENWCSQYFYDSSSSSLLSTHVLITLFGSPSPNLVVLLNVTEL